jgi:hypothetical protein
MRQAIRVAIFLTVWAAAVLQGAAQTPSELDTFFRTNVGLSPDQIATLHNGKAVSTAQKSRTPAEVFVFGAVYINASPESYLKLMRDLNRLREVPGYLAIGRVSDPPRLSDFSGFVFDSDDIKDLKSCKPADCEIQMPSSSIAGLHQAIDWSAPDLGDKVNQRLQRTALERLLAYQHEGNQALGIYNDKPDPTEVPKQFAYMLSYDKVLPEYLPAFYRYLLAYPDGKPASVADTFYWTRVKFGLKPTLRVVHVVTLQGKADDALAYAIAEKQLYSSHYFQTALDLTFCIRNADPKRPGFYLIKAMGSEQAGLTGVKGSVVRRVAVDRSVSSLQKSLAVIKATLETNQ